MKFKGTIIITDPCYVIKGDDWEKCDYGENMGDLGFTNLISELTIYGDWSCTTYECSNPKEAVDNLAEITEYFSQKYKELDARSILEYSSLNDLYDECDKRQDSLNLDAKAIGRFCADAGMVCVLLLDEVLKYRPDFEQWIKDHSWCVTVIENFDGEVEYYVDSVGEAHIIGTGSTDFFTSQTGL